MGAALKCMRVLGLIVLVDAEAAAGECGKSSPDNEAMKLIPCADC